MNQSGLMQCNKILLLFVENRFLFLILDMKMRYYKVWSMVLSSWYQEGRACLTAKPNKSTLNIVSGRLIFIEQMNE